MGGKKNQLLRVLCLFPLAELLVFCENKKLDQPRPKNPTKDCWMVLL